MRRRVAAGIAWLLLAMPAWAEFPPTLRFEHPPEEVVPYDVFIWNDGNWIHQAWMDPDRANHLICKGNTLTIATNVFTPMTNYMMPPAEPGGFQPPPVPVPAPATMWVGFGLSETPLAGYPADFNGTLNITAEGVLSYVDGWQEVVIGGGPQLSTGTVNNYGYINVVDVTVGGSIYEYTRGSWGGEAESSGTLNVYGNGGLGVSRMAVGVHGETGLLHVDSTAAVDVVTTLAIGDGGHGTVELVSGSVQAHTISLGRDDLQPGSALFRQSGGGTAAVALQILATSNNTAQLNLSEGSITADYVTIAGEGSDSSYATASMRQSGGTFTAIDVQIGGDGPEQFDTGGYLEVTGGSFQAQGRLSIGASHRAAALLTNQANVSLGSLHIGGDTDQTAGTLEIQDDAIVAVTNVIRLGEWGQGNLYQNGGAVSAGSLQVNNGTYALSLGSVTLTGMLLIDSVDAGAQARVLQNSGLLSGGTVHINAAAGATASYHLEGVAEAHLDSGTIGSTGEGLLSVQGHATFTAQDLVLGRDVGSHGTLNVGGESDVQIETLTAGQGTASVSQTGGSVQATTIGLVNDDGTFGYQITAGLLNAQSIAGVTLLGGDIFAGQLNYVAGQASNGQARVWANEVIAGGDLNLDNLVLGTASMDPFSRSSLFVGNLTIANDLVMGSTRQATARVDGGLSVADDLTLAMGSMLTASPGAEVTVGGTVQVGTDGTYAGITLWGAMTATRLELGEHASLVDSSTGGAAPLSFHSLSAAGNQVTLDWHSAIRIGVAGQSGEGELQMDGGTLRATALVVGHQNSATMTHNGGSVSVGRLELGGAGAAGVYDYNGSAGATLAAQEAVVGDTGVGVFNHNGGHHLVTTGMVIGRATGSQGTYVLNGGALHISEGSLLIGGGGQGQMTQIGGRVEARDGVVIGDQADSVGVYDISGDAYVPIASLKVANHGTGMVNQHGGVVSAGEVRIGDAADGDGTYQLIGGLLQVGSGTVHIGEAGAGVLRMVGGSVSDGTTRTLIADVLHFGAHGLLESMGVDNVLRVNQVQDMPIDFHFAGSFQIGHGQGSGVGNVGLVNSQHLSADRIHVGFVSNAALSLGGISHVTTDALFVGNGAYGRVVQNAGTVVAVADTLEIGHAAGGWGDYEMLGGVLEGNNATVTIGGVGQGGFALSDGAMQTLQTEVGDAADGSFTQSGGTHTTQGLILGYGGGGSGQYSLNGGQLHATGMMWVGYAGSGNFTQNGGAVNVEGWIGIGKETGSTGSYQLSGGTLTAFELGVGGLGTGSFVLGSGTAIVNSLYVAATGTFQCDNTLGEIRTNALSFAGDSFATGGKLYIGHQGGNGSGAVTLGSGKSLSSRTLAIGYDAAGQFTQTGGTHTVTSSMTLGNSAGSSGTYSLSGTGVLQGGTSYIGFLGQGVFNQSGGSHSGSTMQLGGAAGISGEYSLSSGDLRLSGSLYAGYGGNGTFLQTNGSNQITSMLYLGYLNTSRGTYDLRGGQLVTLSSQYIGYNGAGEFNHSGGSNQTSGLYVGRGAGNGTYRLSGGGVLNVQGEEHIGYGSLGAFHQTGGTHTVASSLVVGSGKNKTGSFNLSGGSLTAAGFYVGNSGAGTFAQSGGTAQAGTLNLGVYATASGTYEISKGALEVGNLIVGKTGSGTFSITGATASVTVATKLTLGANAVFNAASGSKIHMTGSQYVNESTSAANLAGLANLTMVFEGGWSQIDSFEIAGRDYGDDLAGYGLNFDLFGLRLGGADIGYVRLVDLIDNQTAWAGSEALYVNQLYISSGSTLDLNGYHLYCKSFVNQGGSILNGQVSVIPEPAGMLVLAGGIMVVMLRRQNNSRG